MSDHTPVSPAKAEAISKGEDTFDTAVVAISPVEQINRWLRVAVVVLITTTLMSCAVAITITVFRTVERRAADRAISTLSDNLRDAESDLRCRAAASLASDRVATELQIAVAEQFGSAIDGVPPPPDAVVVANFAKAMRKALDVREEALNGCQGEEGE